ncbi:ATP-binding cassette domain-containing protein [Aeromicrobium sp. S22]|uniref:ABC transporter ATP-binding protein n=1 Tax=Aeromicrobium sp. S22 TaxID=2662029 RepID=UPI00129E4C13|nr:ABC transporter ATP-binding protein [Aeromicrobium sp. S22]MRK01911.1 ATP-binding cassette domain-containing protein [Aeromicrobium sp. S22]
MSADHVIEVDRLSVAYGDFAAVRDLSFHVKRGELYALLGSNGAGKTSTLEVVEGHRPVTSGAVRVFGESPQNRSAVRPRMGMMLQESGFARDLTVRDSVGLIGALSGRHDDLDRVLGMAGLTRKRDTRVSQLSGGEKRRLDFATAVFGAPELIILDEPTAGLDIQSRDALWAAVDQLRDKGSTVVLTTHYLEEAQQRADRVGLMHRGTLRREGTVEELTQTLPSKISFALAPGDPEPPVLGARNGAFHVETFDLQGDLHRLLDWAQRAGVELQQLEAGPTRLDDVFRTLDAAA